MTRGNTLGKELDLDAFWAEFTELALEKQFSMLPPFKILRQLFPKMCPMGLAVYEDDLARIVGLEAMCAKYSTPPVGGAIEDWPRRLYQMFENIREAQNDFELDRIKETT